MAEHKLSWWRNGTPRRIGRFVQWQGTTQARAICACGWQGSTFPTRDIEFYKVTGEREFTAHAAGGE